ncbi:NK-tumor recognition protein isoform X4 [Mixophyes fleayi]|uniref:NK-tumor recognition protein isoform X4 n=1 Tax=Mixophyes fleayi TaxID=3061075 RepID=UPI003F4DF0A3
MGEKARPQCYFDIEINREPAGRIIFQLFSDVCPKTCMNFLCLCTGEKGIGKVTGKKLSYKGSTFHRVVKNFMIQGGDFSEGNGKGGESIFGGYFKDENFVLKHDRAFLLSMANRGKHTNGSQFFITTKAAPHLDGIHVVFGLVISGFEVIEQVENLKTDAASRPYADVRVIDCGLPLSKSAKDVTEKIKQSSSESEESGSSSKSSSPSPSSSSTASSTSESEVEIEINRRRKRKRKTKVKHVKRRRRESPREVEEARPESQRSAHSEKNVVAEDKDLNTKRDKPVVRPEEIPPVPENRFLLRRDAPVANAGSEQKRSPAIPENSEQNKGSITKSGRKIRGRGTIRYHTPPRSRSCSESDDDGESSETPPHWKEEMQRLKTYKPPTGEKWSKGDKLNDRLSSRWEEGSFSQRSSSWSHDGYHSDASRERVSRSKARKKDKKIKHKKKSKKVKHTKKHNMSKKDQLSVSHRDESSSRKTKSSKERVRRSSSRDSLKKGRSRSDKERRSSARSSKESYLNSRSRSRSYSRGSLRSRTASKSTSRSRSRSRSRSQTKSRSRNRNVSESHSNTHSHASSKQIKTSSPSPLKKPLPSAGSKPIASTESGDSAVKQTSKSTGESALEYATADNVRVISLSDSPPPSRWKPGQKPWKPSYERIQEIKAKASNILPTQRKYGGRDTKGGSYRKRHASSDSEHSDYSGRSSSYCRRSKNRSSRSRSYSRSYSRSRSRSSSSRAKGGLSSSYDSSSSSESNDGTAPTDTSSSKKPAESKVTNSRSQHENTKEELEKMISTKSQRSRSNSVSSSCSDEDELTKRLLKTTKALLENHNCSNKNEEADDTVGESKMDQQSSTTEKDCTEAIISDIDKVLKNDTLMETVEKVIQEESVSNSQDTNIREDTVSSGKEEGEASSESGSEALKHSKTTPSETASVHASGSVSEKLTKTPSSERSTPETNKSKSKKHKRRSSKKSAKKSHSKKSKDKSKKKKEKKQKSQKKKQSFNWQPPLEFGEDEEEEAAGGEPVVQIKISEHKDLLLNKSSTETKDRTNETLQVDKTSTAPNKKVISISTVKVKEAEPLFNLAKSPVVTGNVTQASDDIKTFTSHRSLPLIKLEKNSSGGTTGGPTIRSSDQISLPSTSVAPITGENMQAKEEKTQSTQPPPSNAPSVEKGEAGCSESIAVDNKWKPVQGPTVTVQTVKPTETPVITTVDQEKKPQGLRIEIKSKNKVRPGSLFDEVRKTARLNQRPRNQESSSEEGSSSNEEKSHSGSKTRFRSKSRSTLSHTSRSRSSSRSSSRSRSSSSSSSYTRSRSRRRYSRHRSRTRSRSYGSYRSYRYGGSASRTNSRSRSRSTSYGRRRRRSRSRSYDSYDSRSRSRSPAYHRSRSYDRRSSRSRRSSYSGSDHSYSHRRRRSGRS